MRVNQRLKQAMYLGPLRCSLGQPRSRGASHVRHGRCALQALPLQIARYLLSYKSGAGAPDSNDTARVESPSGTTKNRSTSNGSPLFLRTDVK